MSLSSTCHKRFPLYFVFFIRSVLFLVILFFSNFEKKYSRTWIILICLGFCVRSCSFMFAVLYDTLGETWKKTELKKKEKETMTMKKSRFSNLVIDRCVACVLLFSRAVDSMSRLSFSSWCHTARKKRDRKNERERERHERGRKRRVTNE